MKELSLERMESLKGGQTLAPISFRPSINTGVHGMRANCVWAYTGFTLATIGLFAAPFTGGISMGLLAFGGFVTSAYGAGSC